MQQLTSLEHGLEVVRVSQCVSILSTRVDIFTMGQCIWLGAQTSCTVADQVVESREVLQPMDLAMCELLSSCEVLEVLVVGECHDPFPMLSPI